MVPWRSAVENMDKVYEKLPWAATTQDYPVKFTGEKV